MKIVKSTYHFGNYLISLTVERNSEKQNSISISVTNNEKSYTIISKYLCDLTEASVLIDVKSNSDSFSLILTEEAPELNDWIVKFNLNNGDDFATFSYGGEECSINEIKKFY